MPSARSSERQGGIKAQALPATTLPTASPSLSPILPPYNVLLLQASSQRPSPGSDPLYPLLPACILQACTVGEPPGCEGRSPGREEAPSLSCCAVARFPQAGIIIALRPLACARQRFRAVQAILCSSLAAQRGTGTGIEEGVGTQALKRGGNTGIEEGWGNTGIEEGWEHRH